MSEKEKLSANEKTDILKHSLYVDVIQEINLSEIPLKRILAYLSKIGDPHSFQMEGYQVELEWKDTNITLQDRMKDIFTSYTTKIYQ